jgi:hypothetical protein
MWIIFIVVLCLVVCCDLTRCCNGSGYLIVTAPDIYARCLHIMSLSQPYKRAYGSSFKYKQTVSNYLSVILHTVGILYFIHALEHHKTTITLY